jgi:TPR repeat protein
MKDTNLQTSCDQKLERIKTDGTLGSNADNDFDIVSGSISNGADNKETCANCGKEGATNTCNKCKLVMYCNAACKKKHKTKHKKACERHVAELHDIELFKDPPELLEDCPICFLRLPYLGKGRKYKSCCGKMVCSGCVYAVQIRDEEALCPFCRVPTAMSREENINRLQKRVKVDDAHAINHLGDFYYDGSYGFPQDYAKALELWHRAAELGCAKSIANIGRIYYLGRSVEVDTKKALQYWEDAAIRGNANARHMLSYVEQKAGNMDRAIKHHMIAVRGGDNSSLAIIQELYSGGQATRDEYTKALRSYQKYLDEVKSSQRDEAATANEKYKYIE